jgi:hypothetical protein
MKRKNIKNQILPAKTIILSYLKSEYLPILDKDNRHINNTYADVPTYKLKKGYTGVTIEYLRKYLFNNKINKDILMAILMDLLKKKQLNVIFCWNVQRLVFECRETSKHSLTTYDLFVRYYVNAEDKVKYSESLKFLRAYKTLKSNLFDNNND